MYKILKNKTNWYGGQCGYCCTAYKKVSDKKKKKKNIPDAEDSSHNAERETIRTWVFR